MQWQQMQVLGIEVQREGSYSTNPQQMDADEILQDPAGRGISDQFPFLVWEVALWPLSAFRMRYSKAAYTGKHAVMTISNAIIRSRILK